VLTMLAEARRRRVIRRGRGSRDYERGNRSRARCSDDVKTVYVLYIGAQVVWRSRWKFQITCFRHLRLS
jgi:hypothetical protein